MTNRHRILVTGPDRADNERILFCLTQELFEAKAVTDAGEAPDACLRFQPDLILLNGDFPESGTPALCQRLRACSNRPILLLLTQNETANRIRALEAGADVCMGKPCDAQELIAQIHALQRRSFPQEFPPTADASLLRNGKYIEYPGLLINLTNYSILYKGHSVETPPKELELFYFLAASPNQVFSREQLLDRLWGFDYIGGTRTVDVHIKRLREKFPATEDWAIKTVWGVGYKFEIKSAGK